MTATDNCMPLPDGRTLGWAEFGDPGGRPLLYCHGFPASRLEARLTDDAARRLGVRVIAPDRPGIGQSTFQPGRTIAGWPADAAALADRLGLDRFAVLGVSGGAPYALACAAWMPERISAVGLVGGLGPLDAPGATDGMSRLNRFFLFLFRRTPRLGQALFVLAAGAARHNPERLFALFTASVPAADRALLSRPEIRAIFLDSLYAAVRDGGRSGSRELYLYTRPWGFDLSAIGCEVQLWHGERDVTVPPAMGRYLSRVLPYCRPRFQAEDGHFSLPLQQMDDILLTINKN